MNKEINMYVAGKVSPESGFGTHDWRDEFCEELSEKTGLIIHNLDPLKEEHESFDLNDSMAVVGKDIALIKAADLVVVYLSDDISVGGSQEMLIAKYYRKPLIGLAPKEGKFNKSQKEHHGRTYKDYVDPFVNVTCDVVVTNIDELAAVLKDIGSVVVKSLDVLDQALEHYHGTA